MSESKSLFNFLEGQIGNLVEICCWFCIIGNLHFVSFRVLLSWQSPLRQHLFFLSFAWFIFVLVQLEIKSRRLLWCWHSSTVIVVFLVSFSLSSDKCCHNVCLCFYGVGLLEPLCVEFHKLEIYDICVWESVELTSFYDLFI